jgi:hypothetical protein
MPLIFHPTKLLMEMRKKTLKLKMREILMMKLSKIMDLQLDQAGFKLELILIKKLSLKDTEW